MIMKENMNQLFKHHFEEELSEMPEPNFELVNAAREKIAKRKPVVSNNNRMFSGFSRMEISVYQAAFAALLITVMVLYYSRQKYSPERTLGEKTYPANSSINSSTVLAGLTQHTLNESSVKSSTVLTSIITFVAKN